MRLRTRSTVVTTVGFTVAAMVLTLTGAAVNAASAYAGSSPKPWVIGVSNGYYGNTARVEYQAELKAYAALPSVAPEVQEVGYQ